MPFPHAWIAFTLAGAVGQTARNALQRELTATLGPLGAAQVRFLFGLPFAIVFLALVRIVGAAPLPALNAAALGWAALGGVSQIAATALMLTAMRERSFVVTTAYIKTEPLQIAVFALLLGEPLGLTGFAAVIIATAGVLLVSWPKPGAADPAAPQTWRPAVQGIVAGGGFGLSAVGFRAAIRALEGPSFVAASIEILVLGLAIQSALLAAYLLVFDRASLRATVAAWRPSLLAGFVGAAASAFWFLAFAIETAARVRTLALVEIVFAQIVSRRVFKQGVTPREAAGMALIAAGVVLLLAG